MHCAFRRESENKQKSRCVETSRFKHQIRIIIEYVKTNKISLRVRPKNERGNFLDMNKFKFTRQCKT
jgi:hypothetical protein